MITGTSAGIGKATAILLAAKGYIVYGAARRVERMDELKGLDIKTLALNLANEVKDWKVCYHKFNCGLGVNPGRFLNEDVF
ncbi:hypothetical protein LZF95_02200 [Algoriphagus sp. AGSA1]|uniref:hypothetical protein n=1 Tax=Algoriphagus sp. AGSA1 TaxID=2907213 RepID=UPI001F43BE1C|nr:hypothetical protein [Algoriphagus sp. AGSA1]MCE7053472.1 hypothetical protein [Algoriphagus sp. AGSA1]